MTLITLDFSASTTVNLIIPAGVGGVITVTLTGGGQAVNLTGALIKYRAMLSPVLDKAVDSGITLTDPTHGVFTITFAAGDTSNHTGIASVAHECRVQLAGGAPQMVFDGSLIIPDGIIPNMT